MSASLLEMTVAIGLLALIVVSATVPTIQTLSTYEQAQLDLRRTAGQALARTRVEQLVNSIWRDADPPAGHAPLVSADATHLQIGDWELRESAGRVEQRQQPGAWAALAAPVRDFVCQYVLDTGAWSDAPDDDELDSVLAVRCEFTDPQTGGRKTTYCLAPDFALAAGGIDLPAPGPVKRYARADYTRMLNLTVATWP